MLTGTELTELRTMVFGADASAVSEEQLQALASYRDKPYQAKAPEHPDYVPPCAYCNTNEAICELATERIDVPEAKRRAVLRGRPDECNGRVLVAGDWICRSCLAAQLESLRKRLRDIHWIELALFILPRNESLVITTEAELDSVEVALSAGI